MKSTIIVYGEQGCGKTQNAETLRKHFGCNSIVDEWAPSRQVVPGALHLTNSPDVKQAIALLGNAAEGLGLYLFASIV